MGASQGQSDSHAGRATKTSSKGRLYEQHPAKVLNLGLILYLAFGAFLFESLGEFQEPLKPASESQQPRAKVVNLGELRSRSVGRMWNITNQLNILYESNWTRLVLDELLEFERQLIESLAEGERAASSRADESPESNNSASEEAADEGGDERSRRARSSRTRSIKKSLIHSLATITTIGSPLAGLRGEWAKLATVLYGTLGIPLLFCAVAQTGRHLARAAANTLLRLRHYCFSLPLHYLCCSCGLAQCLGWLGWCCCCCCCSYLCCRPPKDARKCCDPKRAPRLRLANLGARRAAGRAKRPHRRAAADDGGGSDRAHMANGVGPAKLQGDNFASQQKSVRFSNQQPASNNKSIQLLRATEEEEAAVEEEPLHSPGLLVSSAALLGLYLSLGALAYSRLQNSSLVDGLFVCYELLSVSRLPAALSLEGASRSPPVTSLYQSLRANNGTRRPVSPPLPAAFDGPSLELEMLAWQLLYLICGLNLVSMCGQFARLWLSADHEGAAEELEEDFEEAAMLQGAGLCNGFAGSLAFDASSGAPFAANCCPQMELSSQKAGEQRQYMMQALMAPPEASQLAPGAQPAGSLLQQQQQQIDLAELFVVSQEASPIGLQYAGQPAHQVASDASFASDRSTERSSLCQLHQAASANAASVVGGRPAGAIYGTQPSNYGHRHQVALRSRKDPHLYLAADACTGSLRHRHGPMRGDEDEEREDDYEMDRMLKSCINGNQRSSSSSIHLSSVGQLQQQHHQPPMLEGGPSATGRQLRVQLEPNGCEQDSSLNTLDTTTNSNTNSSVSSRTVKLPAQQHIHIHNGIGFIIDYEANTKQ